MGVLITPHGVRVFSFLFFSCAEYLYVILLGNVTYVDQATADADRLTYVNGAGNAIIKVDNTTTILPAPLVYRKSVSQYF